MSSDMNILTNDVKCVVKAPDQPSWIRSFSAGTSLQEIAAKLAEKTPQKGRDLDLLVYDHDADCMVLLEHASQLRGPSVIKLEFVKGQTSTVKTAPLTDAKNTPQSLFALCKQMEIAPTNGVTLKADVVKIKIHLVDRRTVIRLKPIKELIRIEINNLLYIDPTALNLKERVTRVMNAHSMKASIWNGTLDRDGEIRVCLFAPFPSNVKTFNDFIGTLLCEHDAFFDELIKVYTGSVCTNDVKSSTGVASTQHFESVDGFVVVLDVTQESINKLLPPKLPAGTTQFVHTPNQSSAHGVSLFAPFCTIAGVKDNQLWVAVHPSALVKPFHFDSDGLYQEVSTNTQLARRNPLSFRFHATTFDTSDEAIQKLLPNAVCGSVLYNCGRHFVIIGVANGKLYARVKGDCKRLRPFANSFNFNNHRLCGVTQIGADTKTKSATLEESLESLRIAGMSPLLAVLRAS